MGKFNIKDDEDFRKCREDAENFYREIGEVYCPYFKEKITFNSKGIKHLKFKSEYHQRPINDQYARLKLIKKAPEILNLSHTVQGIWETRKFENQKTNSRWEIKLKDVIYYEFIAVIDKLRIKVIIKSTLGGSKYFWSIIPYWSINKETSTRMLHSGDPDKD